MECNIRFVGELGNLIPEVYSALVENCYFPLLYCVAHLFFFCKTAKFIFVVFIITHAESSIALLIFSSPIRFQSCHYSWFYHTMSSIQALGQRQWNSKWSGLPAEIRLQILGALTESGCSLSRFATVSREWQIEIERHIFAKITVTPSRLAELSSMIFRNRALLRHIRFRIEPDDYEDTDFSRFSWSPLNELEGRCVFVALQRLFLVFRTWEQSSDLTFNISVYTPHALQHLYVYGCTLITPAVVERVSFEKHQPNGRRRARDLTSLFRDMDWGLDWIHITATIKGC